MFHQLNGDPYPIKTLAAFYKNPFAANYNLADLYRVYQESAQNQSVSYNSEIEVERRAEVRAKNIEFIVTFLRKKSGASKFGALSLFHIIGCFKTTGISKEALNDLWPSKDLDEHLTLFERLGLLDSAQASNRLTLNDFLQNFVACRKFAGCDPAIMKALCAYYQKYILD